MQRPAEFTNREAGVGDEGCCEDKSILGAFSSRPQSTSGNTQSKIRNMSTAPTRNGHRGGNHINPNHPYLTSDNLSFAPSSPQKGGDVEATLNDINSQTNFLSREQIEDAAAMLAQLATTPSKDTSYLSLFQNPTNATKYLDEKQPILHHHHQSAHQEVSTSKKHLKRSVSFNHSSRPTSPRQQTSSSSSYIDVAEVLATTVSLVRENNRKLDKTIDEVRGENAHIGMRNNDIEYEILSLSNQLTNMENKYREQLLGKEKLIEELDKDSRRKSEMMQNQGPDAQTTETIRQMEAELRAKNKAITELNKRITVTARQVSDLKEKEKKLEAISNQLARYQTLEAEWKDKQATLDGLSLQLETLRQREAELHEKDALIESLNIRLDTSQQVIAELREKHAPHDLLRQLRQKDYIIDNLTQQVENIDADLKEKDDEIEALASKLAEEAKLMEKLKEQNSQLVPLRTKAEEAEKRSAQLRQQLTEKERVLADLEYKYRESSRSVEDSDEKLRAQEKTINTLRQEIVELQRVLNAQSAENRGLFNENHHIRSNFQGLLDALSEKDQKILQLDQHIESLQQQAAAAAAKNQLAVGGVKDSKNNKNEVRFNALQKVLNTKIEQCRDYEKKISQLEEEYSNLKKQMDDNKTAVSEKDIKIQRLAKITRDLKEEVTQLKEKMEEKEKELTILKSRIPTPAPGSAPAASIRSTAKSVRSRVSSMYSLSGGESSSDEAKVTGRRVRKAASLGGFESPLRSRSVTSTSITSRRLSDASKKSSVTVSSRLSTSTSLSRTKSSTSLSSATNDGESAFKKKAALTKLAVKPQVKPRGPPIKPTTSTVDVLKKAPKKEVSPINRSAVTQRKRDMVVLTNMLSGVASDRKNRILTPAQRRATSMATPSSALTNSKKKLTDNAVSSDSDSERVKRTVASKASTLKKPNSNLATIVERIRKGDDNSVKLANTTQNGSSSNDSNAAGKQRTSLVRPLPSRKPSSNA
ncbi:2549_t:CDS:2 [Ambispora leptoticha]|uniref:2549_t:CDS:1 n=1 Tax=Ambispora leptoticha TaxID=144679 RepID=A0A9N8VMJ6_9GLOM|nr:2549_t:CDS:2 [Ambispora leptoticha]